MIQGREQNGKLIIFLAGVIDSSNAASVEKKLNELYSKHPCDSLELDCDKLEYCTSAGLRVILRLKQRVPDTVLTNVHKALYKIFYITGFTNDRGTQGLSRGLRWGLRGNRSGSQRQGISYRP